MVGWHEGGYKTCKLAGSGFTIPYYNGLAFAKKQLHDRKIINKDLGYGYGATVYGYMMFIMLVSPVWVKKIAYKLCR